ncbi:glycosyltransferase [Streptomyces polychromogenes]|uniref:Glycosyltransferase n=1 Tax=Streptomyces polychromogenes TaxID=67342 RepID=A0ABN0VFZ4_9ACTN
MRTLFVCWAWPSHLYPMVPLAGAARAAGHEVLVACPPSLLPTALRTGLPAVAVGGDVELGPTVQRVIDRARSGDRARRPRPPGQKPPTPLDFFATTAEAMADGLLETCRRWRPDLIVHDATTYAAPAVGAALGIPTARHLWGVDFTHRFRDFEPEAFAALHRRLGVEGLALSGDTPTLDPCPPGLQVPVDYRPHRLRHLPYNGSGRFAHDLPARSPRPRLCVTWGTTSSSLDGADPVLTEVLRAAMDLDADVVFATTGRDSVPAELPPHWHTAVMQPLHLLLPHCDAVVSPGGSGTVMTAVTAGLPQVCVPILPDQEVTAEQLVASGAGLRVGVREAGRESLYEALRAVLHDPGHAAAARGLRDEALAQPTPVQTVRVLEELAGV